ncbi:MAG: hypothetical protein ACYS6W_11535, partial [Planctomycetota bacterium]
PHLTAIKLPDETGKRRGLSNYMIAKTSIPVKSELTPSAVEWACLGGPLLLKQSLSKIVIILPLCHPERSVAQSKDLALEHNSTLTTFSSSSTKSN